MQTSDWIAFALGVVGIVTGFLAFVETIYPPETKQAKRAWLAVFGTLVIGAVVLLSVQQKVSVRERTRSDRKMAQLVADVTAAKKASQFSSQQLGTTEVDPVWWTVAEWGR